MNKNLIVHISDIHVMLGSRHEEYQTVFDRTIADVVEIKPRRIVITGDLFHTKITLSPKAIKIMGKFILELSGIAPVDIFPGNHDWNEQSPAQGNAIDPIVELIHNGYIITKNDKTLPIPEFGNGIYFYQDSGFYNIEDDLIYGNYSCFDGEILTLSEKDPNKKYIALFHGPIYGCRGDNGYELKGDGMIKLSTFNNFDITMLGDIHEHQAFEKDGIERIAFAGSLIQQNYGESMEKGYLVWNLDDCSFKRRFILNDRGFCRIQISAGEDIEDRIRNMKMSLDPTKTKVDIEYEDYQENYSVELLSQIVSQVKKIHGCNYVNADWKPVIRELNDNDDKEEKDYEDAGKFEDVLKDWLKDSDHDDEDMQDVLSLAKEIDKKLNFDPNKQRGIRWELKRMEVCNLFSFPNEKTVFNNQDGITGIFGENYSGKSNIICALVWILYKKMVNEGDSDKLPNLYTNSNKAWGRIYIEIANVFYYIHRTISVKTKKDGTSDVSYSADYRKYTGEKTIDFDNINEKDWTKEDSEIGATEQKAIDRIVTEAIGDYSDFVIVALKDQEGKGGYLKLSQQPKNDIVSKYLGLTVFQDRYKLGNDTFKKVKTIQKTLGDPKELEEQVKIQKAIVKDEEKNIERFDKEKGQVDKKIESYNQKIIEFTKTLIKIENLEETDPEVIKTKINTENNLLDTETKQLEPLKEWLKSNFKKELPENSQQLNKITIESSLKTEKENFANQKAEYVKLDEWLKVNTKKEEINTETIENKILEIKQSIGELESKRKIAKGEKCPTCGHIKAEANPKLEDECKEKIEKEKIVLSSKEQELRNARSIVTNNNIIDKETNRLAGIKISLTSMKVTIDKLSNDLTVCSKIEEITNHNNTIDAKLNIVTILEQSIQNRGETIKKLNEQAKLLNQNKEAIEFNAEVNKNVEDVEHEIKLRKTMNLQLDDKIRESTSNKSVAGNNVENFNEKIKSIKESENIYKKYSIYLQAVHRDGIPAHIIRKKLPIINYRINSVLKNMVNFKIELYIKMNGDIKENFYFNAEKKDSLPLSMGSGAQKFLSSLAISDALHFVSKLTRPAIRIIDEGFGSLDDHHIMEIRNLMEYIKTRYKTSWIITHRNEVKDFVDHNIQVGKTRVGLTEEQIQENPYAGVSVFSFK